MKNIVQIVSLLTLWSFKVIPTSALMEISPSLREIETKKSLYYLKGTGFRLRPKSKSTARSQTEGDDRLFIPPFKLPFWGLPYGVYSNGGFFNPGLFPFVPGGPGFPPFDDVFGLPKVFQRPQPTPFYTGPPPPTNSPAPEQEPLNKRPKHKKPKYLPNEYDDCECSNDDSEEYQHEKSYNSECICSKPVKPIPRSPRYKNKPLKNRPKYAPKEPSTSPCKYGYSSGSRGGCKPPPPPSENEYEMSYAPKCKKGYMGKRRCRPRYTTTTASYNDYDYDEKIEYEPETTTATPPYPQYPLIQVAYQPAQSPAQPHVPTEYSAPLTLPLPVSPSYVMGSNGSFLLQYGLDTERNQLPITIHYTDQTTRPLTSNLYSYMGASQNNQQQLQAQPSQEIFMQYASQPSPQQYQYTVQPSPQQYQYQPPSQQYQVVQPQIMQYPKNTQLSIVTPYPENVHSQSHATIQHYVQSTNPMGYSPSQVPIQYAVQSNMMPQMLRQYEGYHYPTITGPMLPAQYVHDPYLTNTDSLKQPMQNLPTTSTETNTSHQKNIMSLGIFDHYISSSTIGNPLSLENGPEPRLATKTSFGNDAKSEHNNISKRK